MSKDDANRFAHDERVLLVLGCPADEEGRPRPPLERRLRRAIELHRRHDRAPVVLTGGAVKGPTEAEVMARWLRDRGIPEALLRLETAARSTLENLRFSRALIAPGATVHLITERFHMRRARLLAERLAPGPIVEEPVEDMLRGLRRLRIDALERLKLLRDLRDARAD